MSQHTTLHHRLLTLLLGGAAGGLGGCEDPLTDPAVIVGPRIVGARVKSAADPAVAEPAAGEAASIDWLALSDEPGTFSARVVWCKSAPTVIGAPRCDGSTFADQTTSGSWGVPISFDFRVPSDLAPGGTWLAWIGICTGGDAAFEPVDSRFECPAGETLAGFYRGFAPEQAANRNPSLADDSVVLDGGPWLAQGAITDPPAAVSLGAACAGLGLPELRAGQPASIGFELGGDDRETLDNPPGTYASHPRESLVYTHLTNLPGLDRAFSAIDYDAQRLGFDLPYEFSEQPPSPEGMTLGFFLLVRDERGGVDWIERRACLLPR